MQPQMPYGAPQNPQPQPQPQSPYGPPNQLGQQQPYAGPPNYPYPSQGQAPYPNNNMPGTQPQYTGQAGTPGYPSQPPMPQYQPPGGFRQQPNRPAPLPPPPPIQATPYDFFMAQKHPKNTKMPIPGPKQAGFRGKLIWVAGAAIIIMLAVVLISALTPKDTSSQSLITLVQTQQEVTRICDQGVQKAKVQANRNFAINCSTSVASDQAKLMSYLSKQGVKIKAKQLGALANTSSDRALNAAAASSNYDEVFNTVSLKQLNAYASLIQQQSASGQLGTNAQLLLNAELANVKILIGTN